MINGVYLSTMGAMVQASRHGVVANNLANANTVGFKPDVTTMRELLPESVLQPGYRFGVNELLEKTGGGAWLHQTDPTWEVGPFRMTSNPLNAAIRDRNGFFEVERDGKRMLSRDGAFTRNSEGELTLADGETRVLDESGSPIVITGAARIREDGAVLDELTGEPFAQMGLVRVDDLGVLHKRGDNLFDPGEAQLSAGGVEVLPGAVEESAVEPVRSMVAMIEAARAYQANMRLVSIQDQVLGRTVTTVGSVRG